MKFKARAERLAYLRKVLEDPFAHESGEVQIEILSAVVDLLEIEDRRAFAHESGGVQIEILSAVVDLLEIEDRRVPWWRRLWRLLKGSP